MNKKNESSSIRPIGHIKGDGFSMMYLCNKNLGKTQKQSQLNLSGSINHILL